MSTTLDNQTPVHRRTWDLIPWVVNGSAAPADRQLVEEHLATCADCRDELAFQSLIHAGMAIDLVAPGEADAVFGQLLARIEQSDLDEAATRTVADRSAALGGRALRARRPLRHNRTRQRLSRLLVAALALQSVGLVLLGALLLVRPTILDTSAAAEPARYQTLSSVRVPTAAATIRLVPSPSLTVGALQEMLVRTHLRIVDSGQGGAIYTLAPEQGANAVRTSPDDRTDTAHAIEQLRATPGVLLAEPIGAAASAPH